MDNKLVRGSPLRVPLWVLVMALVASAVHMAPFWLMRASTPPGWTFTGNTTVSPDEMQYRVWMRQAPVEGVVVSNRLTAEENKPHLPVLLYFGIGKVSQATGLRPESVYAYLGAPLAFALTVLVYVAASTFLTSRYAIGWVFFVVLLGGGLGGYAKFASVIPPGLVPSPVRKLLLQPVEDAPIFDDYRQHYIYKVLFDTHFLLIWVAATLSVLVLYHCIRRPSLPRALATLLLFSLTTFLHVYTGVTLLAISGAVTALCWRHTTERPARWLGPAAGVLGALATLAVLAFLQRSSGLPFPKWRPMPLPVSILVIGYPVAVLWLSRGFAQFWQDRDLGRSFLLAWVAGCLAVVLAWPFNPYPDRGAMTLQIGLYVLAGSVYFSRRASVPMREAILIALLLGSSPIWTAYDLWSDNRVFSSDQPYTWQSREHREIAEWLRDNGGGDDLLLASPREELWLAPEFPGRHQVAHFFLTVDYERKLEEFEGFLRASDEARQRYLEEQGVRFLFVSRHDGSRRFLDVSVPRDPEVFLGIPGLEPLIETSIGTLFEFIPPEEAASSWEAPS